MLADICVVVVNGLQGCIEFFDDAVICFVFIATDIPAVL
jgi:hypothetical protein